MDLSRALRSDCLRAVVLIGMFSVLFQCRARIVHAQSAEKPPENAAAASGLRDIHSRHFLIHTDLAPREADPFVERMEAVVNHSSLYWGQSMRGVVVCYLMRDLDALPVATMTPEGVHAVRTAGGMTLMHPVEETKRQIPRSVVYAAPRMDVVQHEAVHAYCYQTFSRIGPVWYSEGMAEVVQYWKEGDTSVRAAPRKIEFLHNNPPKSLADPLSPAQTTGDCWQNYASRWALCHFLAYNPNYSRQFRQLGHGFVTGKNVSFEQTYGATTRQLFFEYLLFLEHIGRGYRVDLCAWDWKTKFACLRPGQTLNATIAAGRGWQPTGLTVRSGTAYAHLADGTWRIAGNTKAVDADGDPQGRGCLVGALMTDHRLGEEFELGAKGSIRPTADGDLYLRCRNNWNELADDIGNVTVTLQLEGQGRSRCEADAKRCDD